MRLAARSLVAAALAVLVLAGCESAEPADPVIDATSSAAESAAPTEPPVADEAHSAEQAPATVEQAPVAPVPVEQAPVAPAPVAPAPAAEPVVETDPQFDTCKDAKAAGFGPYVQGADPEYDWYRDSDHDGTTCEK